jgi:ribosomal protein S18 acetylase RimI-like enzyme
MRRFVAERRRHVSDSHLLHPGDLAWQLFHMLGDTPTSDLVRLWEDEQGDLVGFVLAYLPFGGFELQTRSEALAPEMLDWAASSLRRDDPSRALFTMVNQYEAGRIALLEGQGFAPGVNWYYLERPLDEPIPAPELPPGFTIRAITDAAEAEARANLLAGAFEAPPNAERYLRFMQSPAYDSALDLVAVAPDGRLAAFALVWIDPLSETGEFEPVGTAPEFRRLGLGKALLLEGFRRMQARGMERAFVIVEGEDAAAVELYRSAGLLPRWNLSLYVGSFQ